MSYSAKAFIAVCLLAFTAACAAEEEVMYVEPTPVVAEQTYTKY
ncbi:hypothetical protein [Actibacterium sp.]